MILTTMDSIWPHVGSVLLSLVVTFLFNYFIGLPKKFNDAKKAEQIEKDELAAENKKRDRRIAELEEAVSHLPKYREQSKKIQEELQQADVSILEVCRVIKDEVNANRKMLDDRLKSLEKRDKNSLRDKIYKLWRTFTDPYLNPMQAWTDMEKHSFDELVKDYESLGGNDYVHSVVLPDMMRLRVIAMDNLALVEQLFQSRHANNSYTE